MYKCSLERMTDKIKAFSAFGDAGHGGITRYSLSEAAIQARNEFKKRIHDVFIWKAAVMHLHFRQAWRQLCY